MIAYGKNPQGLRCPDCGGELMYSEHNLLGTLAFLDCQGTCGSCWQVRGLMAKKTENRSTEEEHDDGTI